MSRRVIPEVPGYNKIDAISFMKVKIKSNPIWAKRACEILYEQQTVQERRQHFSVGHNNSGFGRNDSPILTKIACKIRQHRETADDLARLQRMLPRYAKQLICLCFDKDGGKMLRKQLDIYYKNKQQNLPF